MAQTVERVVSNDEPPVYLIVVGEGRRCVPVAALEDVVTTEAAAVTALAEVAARLRTVGALGRAVLVEGRSGRRIASLRVGPAVRRRG